MAARFPGVCDRVERLRISLRIMKPVLRLDTRGRAGSRSESSRSVGTAEAKLVDRHSDRSATVPPEGMTALGAARRAAGNRRAGTARPTGHAFEKSAELSELIGGEDRLELPFHGLFQLGDLLALAVLERELVANERRQDVTDRRSATRLETLGPSGGGPLGRCRPGGPSEPPSRWATVMGFELGTVEHPVVIVIESLDAAGRCGSPRTTTRDRGRYRGRG